VPRERHGRQGEANWIFSGIFAKIVSNVVVKPHPNKLNKKI